MKGKEKECASRSTVSPIQVHGQSIPRRSTVTFQANLKFLYSRPLVLYRRMRAAIYLGPSEAVQCVGCELEGLLPALQDGPLGGVGLVLQGSTCASPVPHKERVGWR